MRDVLTQEEIDSLAPDVKAKLNVAAIASGSPLVDVDGINHGQHGRFVPGKGKSSKGRKFFIVKN